MRCFIFIMMFLASTPCFSHAGKTDYCSDTYDAHRSIQYWAKVDLDIDNFYQDSGVLKSLDLHDVPTSERSKVKSYFLDEFSKYVRADLPFIQFKIDKLLDRFHHWLKRKYKGELTAETILEKKEKFIRSEFGDHPAALYCDVKIAKENDLLLILMKTNFAANEILSNTQEVYVEDITYGEPESVKETIEQLISSQMRQISKKIEKIRSCPQ